MIFQPLKRSSRLGCRFIHNRVTLHDIKFRKATSGDKDKVLSLRHNVYRGLDYLPDYYDYFIQDINRRCVVGELDGKMVTFGVMLMLDRGKSVLSQAGRVHEQYEGRGIFSLLNAYINKQAKEYGCVRRVALVETSLNKHARSEKFIRTHREITTKLHYAGVITEEVRKVLKQSSNGQRRSRKINHCSLDDINHLLELDNVNRYLFPHNRILVDYIPYRDVADNLNILQGRNTQFFSSVGSAFESVNGLLTAGSYYRCANPPATYIVDIFGCNSCDLEEHVVFHILRAMKNIPGHFCLQMFVEKGFIAQELRKILLKLDIPKCNWFVEGGVTTKTVVEETYVK